MEQEFRGSILVVHKYVSFSMIFHLNEEMNHKVNKNNNKKKVYQYWSEVCGKVIFFALYIYPGH